MERYFLAQVVRDATMAHTLAKHLKSDRGKGRIAVVFSGRGHIEHGLGIPMRAANFMGSPFVFVLPIAGTERETLAPYLGKPNYPGKRGDFLWKPTRINKPVTLSFHKTVDKLQLFRQWTEAFCRCQDKKCIIDVQNRFMKRIRKTGKFGLYGKNPSSARMAAMKELSRRMHTCMKRVISKP